MTDDLATTKEQLADALSVVDRLVQILEQQLGKDAPQAIEAREERFKLTQLAMGVQRDESNVQLVILPFSAYV